MRSPSYGMSTEEIANLVREHAESELLEEKFRAAVEAEKNRLRTFKPWWHRVFPFIIEIRRRGSSMSGVKIKQQIRVQGKLSIKSVGNNAIKVELLGKSGELMVDLGTHYLMLEDALVFPKVDMAIEAEIMPL